MIFKVGLKIGQKFRCCGLFCSIDNYIFLKRRINNLGTLFYTALRCKNFIGLAPARKKQTTLVPKKMQLVFCYTVCCWVYTQISNKGRYSISNIYQKLTICQQMLKIGASISFFFCNVMKKLVPL